MSYIFNFLQDLLNGSSIHLGDEGKGTNFSLNVWALIVH